MNALHSNFDQSVPTPLGKFKGRFKILFPTQPLPTGIGVELIGMNAEEPIGESSAHALRQLWLDEGIVVFRGAGTSPEALLNISRCFGDLEPHPIERFRLAGYPDLIVLSNEEELAGPVYQYDGTETYGRIPWHTDLAFTDTPNAGAVLRMVQTSRHGGQTGWIDTERAWEALDKDMKLRIENLEAVYVFCPDLSAMRFNKEGGVRVKSSSSDLPSFPPVAHPLVWVHPDTGRRILNISTLHIQSIIGLSREEGDNIIQALVDHALQPRFQYVHEWQADDVIAWDNRRTMHMAFGHPVNEVRIVQRSTIRGRVRMGRVLDSWPP